MKFYFVCGFSARIKLNMGLVDLKELLNSAFPLLNLGPDISWHEVPAFSSWLVFVRYF